MRRDCWDPSTRTYPPSRSPGAVDAWRGGQWAAANTLCEMLATSYGPHGGTKVIVDGNHYVLLTSGAAAVTEVASGPLLDPYVRLAKTIQQMGDHGTGALFLAAHMVRSCLEAGPAILPGLQLAAKQARAVLDSMATPDEGSALYSCGPRGAIDVLLARTGRLPLDKIGVEPGTKWGWRGARTPKPLRHAEGPVLVLERGPRKIVATFKVRGAAGYDAARRMDSSQWLDDALPGIRLATVVVGGELGPAADALRARGVFVWEHAPRDARWRAASCTQATQVPPEGVTAQVLGHGQLERDATGGWLGGAGPQWTLTVPDGVGLELRKHDTEQLLRAYGSWCVDPRAVSGWRESIAASLARGRAVVPGRGPIAWQAAEDAFRALDVAYQGPPSKDVLPCVDAAISGAFACARLILRTDAVHARVPSSPERLRGPGRPGSPKGMPGDIPPLM